MAARGTQSRASAPGASAPRRTRAATIGDLGEFGLIDRIARAVRPPTDGVVLGIGDDTAVLDTGGARLLLATVDMQVEGRHFLRRRTPPEQLGRRVAAVNLSDIGAMGGSPRWALVSLALPKRLPVAWVEDFYRGLDRQLAEFGAHVVGGNLSGGGRIVADLTLLGEVDRGRLVRRSGARPGDLIGVTGALGRSAAGRAALDAGLTDPDAEAAAVAHLAPTPRVREGQALAAAGVTAMLDLSDGLASDLGHLCAASGVGARVDVARLPVAAEAVSIAGRVGLDPLAFALAGGEDFELCFTAPAATLDRLQAAIRPTNTPLSIIGEVTPAAAGRVLVLANGERRALHADGWDHFRRGS